MWYAQSCLTLCNPMDYSPPGSSVHGVFQTRILQWAAISSSRGSSRSRDGTGVTCVSCIGGGFFTTTPPGKPHFAYVCVHVYPCAYTHGITWQRGSQPLLYSLASWTESLSAPLPVGHTFPASFAGSLASPSWQMLECYRSALRCIFVYTHFPDDSIRLHGFKQHLCMDIVSKYMSPHLGSYQTHTCQHIHKSTFTWLSDKLHMPTTEPLISTASLKEN